MGLDATELRSVAVRALRRARKAVDRSRTVGRLRALADRPDSAPRRGTEPCGAVDRFDDTEVVGWIDVPDGSAPTRVALFVNELEVAATWATDDPTRVLEGPYTSRTFRIAVRDLWQYCTVRDRLSVQVDGWQLPDGTRRPNANGRSSAGALRRKLRAGYVFSHGGVLQLSKSLDLSWQHTIMELYRRVRAVVAAEFGQDVFLIYGSLLGAVREHGFIGHDRDFDCAFVSEHTVGRDAASELARIGVALIDAGLDVECRRTALHIHDAQRPAIRIDLFHLFFDDAGLLCFPFGIAGTSRFTKDDWQGTKEIEFAGAPALLPQPAEQLVEHIYGSGWRLPTPGFNWRRDRTTRSTNSGVPEATRDELYWTNFYARAGTLAPSPFFEECVARTDLPGVVLDLGCGDGRDALAFAAKGKRVIGVDRSAVALDRARAAAATRALSDAAEFHQRELDQVVEVGALIELARERASGGPVLLYARFFLHAITGTAQKALLGALREHSQPGDFFATEFRSDADEANLKASPNRYRRFVNGPALAAQLHERCGFTVLAERQGTGLSPFRGEDPDLYRIIAKR